MSETFVSFATQLFYLCEHFLKNYFKENNKITKNSSYFDGSFAVLLLYGGERPDRRSDKPCWAFTAAAYLSRIKMLENICWAEINVKMVVVSQISIEFYCPT